MGECDKWLMKFVLGFARGTRSQSKGRKPRLVRHLRHLLRHDPMPVLGLLSSAGIRGETDLAGWCQDMSRWFPRKIWQKTYKTGALFLWRWGFYRILGTQKDLNWLATSGYIRMAASYSGIKVLASSPRLSQLSRRSLSKDLLSTEAGNVQLVQLWAVDVKTIKHLKRWYRLMLANLANSKPFQPSPILP